MSEIYGHVAILFRYLGLHSMENGGLVIWQAVILFDFYFLDYSDAFCGI